MSCYTHVSYSIHALFKPCVDGDSDGWHRVPIEWVAYQLNLMLGMDYVPPVAYLHNVDIPGHGRFASGAMLCTWCGGSMFVCMYC